MSTKILIVSLAFLLSACGAVQHNLKLNEGYQPPADFKVAVGEVSYSGQYADLEPQRRLRDALAEAFRKKDLLAQGNSDKYLVLDSQILEYEPGNAFKRWMLPGWGATILSVRAVLRDGEKIAGTAEARRTISIGGGYSIGAWKTIFPDVAEDVAEEIATKLKR